MYFRRLAVLLVIAAGTTALAEYISKSKTHLGRASSAPTGIYTKTFPNGQQQTIDAETLARLIRNRRPPVAIPANAPTVIQFLARSVFYGLPPSLALVTGQSNAILITYGVAIPNSKDRRILVYLSEGDNTFYLVADFLRPTAETIDGVQVENDQLVFSADHKELYRQPIELPDPPQPQPQPQPQSQSQSAPQSGPQSKPSPPTPP